MIRYNPAASYDLGAYRAAACFGDEEDLARITDVHRCEATMDYASARFEREYDEWLEAQIEASMQDA